MPQSNPAGAFWVQLFLSGEFARPPLPFSGPPSPGGPHFLPGSQNKVVADSRSFHFDRVGRLTAGAVGPPGGRTFYLQVEDAGETVSLILEKEQLRVLVERLEELLPSAAEQRPLRDMNLREPVQSAWRVGTMTLAYDEQAQTFEVSLVELVEEGDKAASGRFLATSDQMRALIRHATAVIAAGRPPCPLCGGPIDHDGGVCPRLNGHH